MTTVPLPSPRVISADQSAELLDGLTDAEAIDETNRCLYCYDAPCMQACPTHIDIPGFIRKINTGNTTGAARRSLRDNFLGGTCARVCPVKELCEGACVLNATDKPISIGRLQRYAVDTAVEHMSTDAVIAPFIADTTDGARVLVVGSGPAGLSAAAHLAQKGHRVTVWERDELPGGLSSTGIIPLREPLDVALEEVDMVRSLGVEIELSREMGGMEELEASAADFDAVFLATGLGAVPELRIPGADAIRDGLGYVRTAKLEPDLLPAAGHVVVIGAGNTAIDAATMARRSGAEATIVYRRTAAEMTAYEHEYQFALGEGINFRFLASPVEIAVDAAGNVTGLVCEEMELGEADGSGRRRPVATGNRTVIGCDLVVRAIGQEGYDGSRLPLDRGYIAVDDSFRIPGMSNIFAGGDAVRSTGTASTVMAVEDGKLAAAEIDTYLESAAMNAGGDDGRTDHNG
jgi:glutamate synthase (NADPH/NADH) small chain